MVYAVRFKTTKKPNVTFQWFVQSFWIVLCRPFGMVCFGYGRWNGFSSWQELAFMPIYDIICGDDTSTYSNSATKNLSDRNMKYFKIQLQFKVSGSMYSSVWHTDLPPTLAHTPSRCWVCKFFLNICIPPPNFLWMRGNSTVHRIHVRYIVP